MAGIIVPRLFFFVSDSWKDPEILVHYIRATYVSFITTLLNQKTIAIVDIIVLFKICIIDIFFYYPYFLSRRIWYLYKNIIAKLSNQYFMIYYNKLRRRQRSGCGRWILICLEVFAYFKTNIGVIIFICYMMLKQLLRH